MITLTTVQGIVYTLSSIRAGLNADIFIQKSVEIIRQETQADLIGFWSFTVHTDSVVLQAYSGNAGSPLIPKGHEVLLVNSPNLFGPVANGDIRIIDGWSGYTYGCKVLDDIEPNLDLPIPLIKQNEVMHSENAPSYISVDLPAPRWEIVLPLRRVSQVYGALYIQILEFSKFTLDAWAKLQWLADQVTLIYLDDGKDC
jgi:hypothetical protein